MRGPRSLQMRLALGIGLRNLINNALRHGQPGTPIRTTLSGGGRLTHRFERGSANAAGSGLGLAIVAKIAERIGSALPLASR